MSVSATDTASPCQCHTSWAYITNRHRGHCCFFPADQDCHADEVALWERRRDQRNGRAFSAQCENDIEFETTDGTLDAVRCSGTLRFGVGDSQAKCDTCGAWTGRYAANLTISEEGKPR